MKLFKLIYIVSFIMIMSCQQERRDFIPAKPLSWISGTWMYQDDGHIVYEEWSQVNKDQFEGKSYFLENKDTIILETIRIEKNESKYHFSPIVKSQNGGKAIRFIEVSMSDTNIVFENLKHDFPNQITYTKLNGDSLLVEISGLKEGEKKIIFFYMKHLSKN